MRFARDDDGILLVVVKQSAESVAVRDPATGEEHSQSTSDLRASDTESPFIAVADVLPTPEAPPLSTITDDRALGLLAALDASGPRPVTELLDVGGLCESDLHGATSELRAAGLLEATNVDGYRGYRVTDLARNRLEGLRD